MFIDEAIIEVKAGDGGNGCYAHERLKYIPRGRPSGGRGGRGGHIIIAGSPQLHTLQDVAYRHTYKAERGAHGKGSNKTGKDGADVIMPVPLGTIIIDDETGETLLDCLREGQKKVVARGGRGGRGNAALITHKNPNPERAEFGKPGQQRKLRLVLKSLADIGLVGRPNAGKSTFISRVSKAHPKVADYPFTTTEPHLGIVSLSEYESFVMADIPGLIEGSHEGKGLGIRFLKHIERTRALAILIECITEDPQEQARVLLEELRLYSPLLAEKPKMFVLTKIDLDPALAPNIPKGWLTMSAVSGAGVEMVLRQCQKLLVQTTEL